VKLAVTVLLLDLPLERSLEKEGTQHHHRRVRSPSTLTLQRVAAQQNALREKQKLDDNGFTISALSCTASPARFRHREKEPEVARKTILLAEKLGVPWFVISRLSGQRQASTSWAVSPGASPGTAKWQWKRSPYWQSTPGSCISHGAKIAIEMHPATWCTARRHAKLPV
jgi:sugar phosphate isomerase/epimerase